MQKVQEVMFFYMLISPSGFCYFYKFSGNIFANGFFVSKIIWLCILIDFKKAQPEEKLNLFSSLLKSYQEEVDNLTKRAKFGENAFLNIYQKLYEAPDPYPALASIGVSAKGFCMGVVFEQRQ